MVGLVLLFRYSNHVNTIEFTPIRPNLSDLGIMIGQSEGARARSGTDQPTVIPPPMTRAFVCVTGQLKRLELASKMASLIDPLLDVVSSVDVALVLSDGQVAFTNPDQKAKGASLTIASSCGTNWTTLNACIHDLATDLPQVAVQVVKWQSPLDPLTSSRHVKEFDKGCNEAFRNTTKESIERQQWCANRAVHHVRQYFAMAECASVMTRNLRRGVTSVPYSVVVRVREDIVLAAPIDALKIRAQLTAPSAVVTAQCHDWGGINDKLTFFNADSGYTGLIAPLHVYYGMNPVWTKRRLTQSQRHSNLSGGNPEEFLQYAYRSVNLTLRTNPSLIPIKVRLTEDYGHGRYSLHCKEGLCTNKIDCFNASGFKLQSSRAVRNAGPNVTQLSCRDVPGYHDQANVTCDLYTSRKWCTSSLGEGPNWPWSNSLQNQSRNINGMTAQQACCGCGGGILSAAKGR
jgi:hypothetical protein